MTELPRYSMVSVDVTERCNLRCAHCRSHLGAYDPPFEKLARYVAELGRLRPRILVFSGGEPLLRADLVDLVARATATGAAVQVNTNGTELDEGYAHRLADAGVTYVQVSIEGPPDLHESIRGPRTFDRALAACRSVLSSSMRLVVNTTVSRANLESIEPLGTLLFGGHDPLRAYVWGLKRFVPVARRDREFVSDNALGPDGLARLVEIWRSLRAHFPDVLVKTDVPQTNQLVRDRVRDIMARYSLGCAGCSAGVQCLTVRSNGDVAPCPTLYVSCGNLDEMGIDEVLLNPTIAALRSRSGWSGSCATCPDRLLCGGCRALAFVTGGDLLGSDPECFARPCAD